MITAEVELVDDVNVPYDGSPSDEEQVIFLESGSVRRSPGPLSTRSLLLESTGDVPTMLLTNRDKLVSSTVSGAVAVSSDRRFVWMDSLSYRGIPISEHYCTPLVFFEKARLAHDSSALTLTHTIGPDWQPLFP